MNPGLAAICSRLPISCTPRAWEGGVAVRLASHVNCMAQCGIYFAKVCVSCFSCVCMSAHAGHPSTDNCPTGDGFLCAVPSAAGKPLDLPRHDEWHVKCLVERFEACTNLLGASATTNIIVWSVLCPYHLMLDVVPVNPGGSTSCSASRCMCLCASSTCCLRVSAARGCVRQLHA